MTAIVDQYRHTVRRKGFREGRAESVAGPGDNGAALDDPHDHGLAK